MSAEPLGNPSMDRHITGLTFRSWKTLQLRT